MRAVGRSKSKGNHGHKDENGKRGKSNGGKEQGGTSNEGNEDGKKQRAATSQDSDKPINSGTDKSKVAREDMSKDNHGNQVKSLELSLYFATRWHVRMSS